MIFRRKKTAEAISISGQYFCVISLDYNQSRSKPMDIPGTCCKDPQRCLQRVL